MDGSVLNDDSERPGRGSRTPAVQPAAPTSVPARSRRMRRRPAQSSVLEVIPNTRRSSSARASTPPPRPASTSASRPRHHPRLRLPRRPLQYVPVPTARDAGAVDGDIPLDPADGRGGRRRHGGLRRRCGGVHRRRRVGAAGGEAGPRPWPAAGPSHWCEPSPQVLPRPLFDGRCSGGRGHSLTRTALVTERAGPGGQKLAQGRRDGHSPSGTRSQPRRTTPAARPPGGQSLRALLERPGGRASRAQAASPLRRDAPAP